MKTMMVSSIAGKMIGMQSKYQTQMEGKCSTGDMVTRRDKKRKSGGWMLQVFARLWIIYAITCFT